MLLAATNHICQDVAVVPFLWVVPLALYLLSFIICFDHQRWYVRGVWTGLTLLAIAAVVVAENPDGPDILCKSIAGRSITEMAGSDVVETLVDHLGIVEELVLYSAMLFFVCMVCHGELVRLRPDPRHLTEFYLLIAAGGAVGGACRQPVGAGALRDLLGMAHCAGGRLRDRGNRVGARRQFGSAHQLQAELASEEDVARCDAARKSRRRTLVRRLMVWTLLIVLPAVAVGWVRFAKAGSANSRVVARAQLLRSRLRGRTGRRRSRSAAVLLCHGRITHGLQFTDPEKSRWATTYYGEDSGVGQAILYFRELGAVRVGAVGLGVGTLASYAQPGDDYRFYEINPAVLRMAKTYFTYLRDCRGRCEVTMGDARLSLERQTPQRFNVLVLDAFSGDAIPTHLLTREAFEIYERHRAPGGVIAIHISNRYLDLAPVVRGLAEHFHLKTIRICDDSTGIRRFVDLFRRPGSTPLIGYS